MENLINHVTKKNLVTTMRNEYYRHSFNRFTFLILYCTLFLITTSAMSVVSREASAQFSPFSSNTGWQRYSNQEHHVEMNYPPGYESRGEGKAWFAEFSPGPDSSSSLVIFISAEELRTTSLLDDAREYVQSLRNSPYFSNLQVISTTTVKLGGETAYGVGYRYTSSNGVDRVALDIITKDPYSDNQKVTLSFLTESADFPNSVNTIAQVRDSFGFIPASSSSFSSSSSSSFSNTPP